MTLTLLLDLDDTLLNTDLESFVPIYFQSLSQYLQPWVSTEKVVPALIAGMSAMNANEDPRRTLREAFESEFYPRLGIQQEALTAAIPEYFRRAFPALARHTTQNPEAIRFLDWAISAGHRVAIATDPLFYRAAVEERVRWAGFNPEQFELISSADHFHFTKSHPAYFAEMLGRLGWPDGPVLMVGNDYQRDIVPAGRLGLKTFLIETGSGIESRDEMGRGTFEDLRTLIESTDPSTLEPTFKSRDGIMGITSSTPAVLLSMCLPLSDTQWSLEPTRDDWAITEIASHLRDTEREVHAMQLELMIEKADAFIPRPETSVWANERDYLSEDGATALTAFAEARIQFVNKLGQLPAEIWKRKARHAIFGPTDFQEIMSFVADHDRLHLQQAWKTVQSLRVSASI